MLSPLRSYLRLALFVGLPLALSHALGAEGDVGNDTGLSLTDTFHRGGFLLWVLSAILFFGTVLGVKRLFSLSKAKNAPRDFDKDVVHVADTKGIDAGISFCREKPSALARVLQAALMRHGAPLSQLESAVRHATALERFALLRRGRLFGHLAALSPLVGLVGFFLNAGKFLEPWDSKSGDFMLTSAVAGVGDGWLCMLFAAATTLTMLLFHFAARSRADDLAHDIEARAIDAVLTLDRKARQSIRLIEDIEEKIKTESMIRVPDLSAEFDERPTHESALKTAVTTHEGEPVKDAKADDDA